MNSAGEGPQSTEAQATTGSAPAGSCGGVWCAIATVSNRPGSSNLVGFGPPADYPGSTRNPATFTHGNTAYSVGLIVNNTSSGKVSVQLSPALEASQVSALTLHIGDVALAFSGASYSNFYYSWTDAAQFGAGNTLFVDGGTLRLRISESSGS